MKLEIELRDGFSPSDFENLKSTLTKFFCKHWESKGFTKADDETISFNIMVEASTNPMHSDNNNYKNNEQ